MRRALLTSDQKLSIPRVSWNQGVSPHGILQGPSVSPFPRPAQEKGIVSITILLVYIGVSI
jgi:hypothetical protein